MSPLKLVPFPKESTNSLLSWISNTEELQFWSGNTFKNGLKLILDGDPYTIIENNIENFNLKFFKFLIAIFPGIIAAIFIAFNPISIENHQIMESVLQNEFNQNCYMSCELLKTKSSILDQFRGNFGSYSFEVFLRYFFIIATGFGPIFLLLYNCELKNKNLLVPFIISNGPSSKFLTSVRYVITFMSLKLSQSLCHICEET